MNAPRIPPTASTRRVIRFMGTCVTPRKFSRPITRSPAIALTASHLRTAIVSARISPSEENQKEKEEY